LALPSLALFDWWKLSPPFVTLVGFLMKIGVFSAIGRSGVTRKFLSRFLFMVPVGFATPRWRVVDACKATTCRLFHE
jgi:hypothetical protein